jgi:hypothetical protein
MVVRWEVDPYAYNQTLTECDEGEWVRYEDYEKVAASVAKLSEWNNLLEQRLSEIRDLAERGIL